MLYRHLANSHGGQCGLWIARRSKVHILTCRFSVSSTILTIFRVVHVFGLKMKRHEEISSRRKNEMREGGGEGGGNRDEGRTRIQTITYCNAASGQESMSLS